MFKQLYIMVENRWKSCPIYSVAVRSGSGENCIKIGVKILLMHISVSSSSLVTSVGEKIPKFCGGMIEMY